MSGSSYGPDFDRLSARIRSAGVCRSCGGAFHPSLLDAHHLIPRRYGGPDTAGNLIPLCDACHALAERETREAARRLAEARARLVESRARATIRRRAIPPELSPRTYAPDWPERGSLADRLRNYRL